MARGRAVSSPVEEPWPSRFDLAPDIGLARGQTAGMEFQLSVSAPDGSHRFEVWVEPEGMYYQLSEIAQLVLSFRGPDAMRAELTHRPDKMIIWRPADTEVWASVADGEAEQIAGWHDNPAPGLDSNGRQLSVPGRELIERLFHPTDPTPLPADRRWWRTLLRPRRR